MAQHTIMFPDWMVGRELRSIVWDDDAGTVEGEHSHIDDLREALAEPTPLLLPSIAASWTLNDPAHDPADFLALLSHLIDDRAVRDLPPVFDGVEPTPGVAIPCSPGAVQ